MEAKLFAKEKMINQRTPKILNDNLLSLVGLKVSFDIYLRHRFGLANLINTYYDGLKLVLFEVRGDFWP